MIKIGVDIDEKLIILLKEMLDYEFINTKRESSSFEIFIIDIDTENITDKIKANYKKGNSCYSCFRKK